MNGIFKLYPWEWVLSDEFGKHVLRSLPETLWLEPLWKTLLSNKALLAVLWELYPGHPNLLPSYLNTPSDLTSYVQKPLLGREGASMQIVTPSGSQSTYGQYGAEGFVYQDGRMYPAANETIPLLGDAEATAFEAACRAAGGKLFQGLLAAVGIALHRVSGVDTYRGFMPVGERREARWRHAFGWFVNTLPIEFPVAGREFPEVLAGVQEAWAELIENVDVPFIKAWELLAPQYYGLRGWPFPVNFFSFLDFRRLIDAEKERDLRATTMPQASHANTGNMWFFRNSDGVSMNTIFANTPEGRASMAAYRSAIKAALVDAIRVEVAR